MPLSRVTLDALVALIREEGPAVLASPEDADYFRKTYQATPKPQAPPVRPVPAPVIAAPPLPPPPKAVEPPPKPVEISKPQPVSFSSLRSLVSIIAPELRLIDEIPSDAIAKKLSERWKAKNQTAPLSILTYQEPPEQRALLEGIAQALDVYFGPTKLVSAESIEKAKQWDAFLSTEGLKMVIVCDYTLWQLPHLLHFYKETPAQGTRLLGQIPLFLLPDLSLYLKDALLKRSLWKALCQRCT